MAFSKSVQFRGIKNVVKAYQNKKVPQWGLFQGTQFLEKYEGDDTDEGATLLRDYLDALDQRSNDTNTYTLCVYEVSAGTKITSATKYDASFNFRIADTIEDHLQSKVSGVFETRITGIEDKLNQLLSDPEPEEMTVKDQLFGALGKILEVPQVQQALAAKLLGLIDGIGNTVTGIFTPAVPPRAIGHARPQTNVDEENKKLQEAVTILCEVDPQLGTNLLKLAGIAKADPSKYNLLITMLKTM